VIDELSRELAAVGIRGRLRARILAEAAEHLRDTGSPRTFGDPRALAGAFAAELGTHGALAAAQRAFAALAVAGAVYAAAFVSLGAAAGGASLAASTSTLGDFASAVIVIAPQLALAAGLLAIPRAFRRRREPVLPSAELVVLNRRTAAGLACGVAAMAGFVLYAAATAGLAGWWTTFVYAGCGGSILVLAVASAPLAATARLRPQVAGDAGDLFDDLPLERFRGRPWKVAALLGLVLFVVASAAGAAQGDPFDGMLRGVLEAAACLAGFGVLGRFLGIRR
jgi:hypothetical protein